MIQNASSVWHQRIRAFGLWSGEHWTRSNHQKTSALGIIYQFTEGVRRVVGKRHNVPHWYHARAHTVIFNKLVVRLTQCMRLRVFVCLDCMALADLMRNLFGYITGTTSPTLLCRRISDAGWKAASSSRSGSLISGSCRWKLNMGRERVAEHVSGRWKYSRLH